MTKFSDFVIFSGKKCQSSRDFTERNFQRLLMLTTMDDKMGGLEAVIKLRTLVSWLDKCFVIKMLKQNFPSNQRMNVISVRSFVMKSLISIYNWPTACKFLLLTYLSHHGTIPSQTFQCLIIDVLDVSEVFTYIVLVWKIT